MRNKLQKILQDALCVKHQTETQKIQILQHANHYIIAGLRIVSELGISDFDSTCEVINFIKSTRVNLEVSENEINDIIDFSLEIKLNKNNWGE